MQPTSEIQNGALNLLKYFSLSQSLEYTVQCTVHRNAWS